MPPIGSRAARWLILGSLPGDMSIQQQRYYAHPQNQFWRIMRAVCDAPSAASYEEHCALLVRHEIAVWDVLASAERNGSLDSAIRSAQPNAIASFLKDCSRRAGGIAAIAFNGQKAAALFRTHILPTLDADLSAIATMTLPSTSPAAARMPMAEKTERWRAFLDFRDSC